MKQQSRRLSAYWFCQPSTLALAFAALLVVLHWGRSSSSVRLLADRPPPAVTLAERPGATLASLGKDMCDAVQGPITHAAAPSPSTHLASAFTSIYASLRWGADGDGSGSGSTLRATSGTRTVIEMLVWRHHVTRLLDAPCGSAHWWPPLLRRLRAAIPCFTYRGLDVVPSVIAADAARYAGDAQTSFALADLSVTPLTPGAHDMILCRDALQHIPLLDAIAVLENFARARPRILAVGSYFNDAGTGPREANRNIPAGEYFHINLMAAPFNMSAPLDVLDENTPVRDTKERKFLLVFSGEYLAGLDFDAMREAARTGFGAVTRKRSNNDAGSKAGRIS